MDLTTTIRFSNLPNRATVEMVEAERKREEHNVIVGLLLEDGKLFSNFNLPVCTCKSFYKNICSVLSTLFLKGYFS